jgi:RNA polymerase sigma factor (sigma-70 family)
MSQSDRSDEQAWRIRYIFMRLEEGDACENEKEFLANWLLQQCLTAAYTVDAQEGDEIGVVAAEQLWQQIERGQLRWIAGAGLASILKYIRRHVVYVRRQLLTEHAQFAQHNFPLEEALFKEDEMDITEMIAEQMDWETVLIALREELESLSAQQQLVIELRLAGLEPREIAQQTGIAREQVNVVLSQAYKRLRQQLQQRAQKQPVLAEALRSLLGFDAGDT